MAPKLEAVRPGIDIRMLDEGDGSLLDRVAPDVFDYAIDARRTAEFLSDARHHLAVAMDADLVVGMATAVHYVHPDKGPELWINEVGVSTAYRGQGIGRRILRALFGRARELGCSEAWVCTEHDNRAARRLYNSAGGVEQDIVYVTFALDGEQVSA